MRIPKAAFWALLIFFLAGIVYGLVLIRRGFSTQTAPSSLETAIARSVRGMSIPSSAKDVKNPYPVTPENIKPGLEHYADHCAICHANDGSGNTEMGPNLYPRPPDMRLAETQDLSDGELFYIINNGVRMSGMPGWAKSHTPEDTWKLVLFIRSLPHLSAEDKKEMEKFNPKNFDDDDEHGGTDHPHLN